MSRLPSRQYHPFIGLRALNAAVIPFNFRERISRAGPLMLLGDEDILGHCWIRQDLLPLFFFSFRIDSINLGRNMTVFI